MCKIKSMALVALLLFSQIIFEDCTDESVSVKAASQTMNVNVPPTVEIVPDVSSGKAPLTVHFDGDIHDEDGEVLLLEWDFQGDGVFEFSKNVKDLQKTERLHAVRQGLQKEYTYTNPGIYHAVVRVTDDKEESSVSSVTIQVHSDRPYLDVVSCSTGFDYMAQAEYEAFFKSGIAEKEGIRFQMGNYWISYSMENQVFGEINQVKGIPEGNKIWYSNVFLNADIRYTVYNDLLLEELIVHQFMPITVIEQSFVIHGVEYRMHEDNSIGFYNGEDLIFSIPQPVMYEFDNPQKKSYGLHYEVIERENDYLLRKVIDDLQWLKTAKYPVVIDSSTQGELADPWEQQGLTPYGQYFKNLNEYVDPLTGHLTIKHTDYTLSGRGLDLSVTRVYSTVVAYKQEEDQPGEYVPVATYQEAPTDLGYGWRLDFPWMEIKDEEPGKYMHLPNGTQVQTDFQNGIWENPVFGFTMVENPDNTYTKYRKDGIKEEYDSKGRVTSITDLNGNVITFLYGQYGLSSITDTVGRVLNFNYSGGKLISISDGVRTITYGYAGDKLVSVTDPLGRITTYTYLTGNSFLITGVHYPSGGFSTYDYGMIIPATGKLAPYKSSESNNGETTYYVYKVDTDDTVTWTSPKDINAVTVSGGRPCVLQRDDGSLVMYFKDKYVWTEENCYWNHDEWVCDTITHTEYWIKRSVSTDQHYWSTPENVIQVKSTTGNPVVIEKQDGTFVMFYKDKYVWTEENCYWEGCPRDCQYVCEPVTHTEYWIYRRTSTDGLIWGSPIKVQQTTFGIRNIAAIQKQDSTYLMCYTDKVGTTYYIRQKTSSDGITWGSPSNVIQVDSGTGNPSLLQRDDGTVYLAFRKSDNYIYVSSNSGSGWSSPVQTTSAEGDPALLETDSDIVIIFKGTDGHCYRISSSDGVTWTSPSQIAPNKIISDPATVTRKDRFYRVTAQYISASVADLVKVLEFSYEGDYYLPDSCDVLIRDDQTLRSSIHFEYDSKGRIIERISKDEQGVQTEKIVYTYNSKNKVIRQDVYAGASTGISYSTIMGYDNKGNVIYTRDPEGAEHFYSYANTNCENQFTDSKGDPVNLFSNTFYTNSVPSNCHTLIVGEAFINSGKVQETYYKYDANGNLIETKTLFPTREYAVFSDTFDENTQTTFEFDLTELTITDGILMISSIAIPTQETLHETHSEVGNGWLNSGSWSGKYFLAEYLRCQPGTPPDCFDGETKTGPFEHYPGSPNYTGYTTWVEDNRTQYVQTSYSAVVNEYPEETEYRLNGSTWTVITSNLGSGTTSIDIPASEFTQGSNTLQFQETNTFTTEFEWTLYIDQGSTPEEYTTSHAYDSYGNRISVTDPEGNTTTFEYSADYGHAYLTCATTALGGTLSATYDFATGYVLSITDLMDYTTIYEYDILGRVTKKINPDLSEEEAVYDDYINCITIYDELDHFTKRYFDGLGRTTFVEFYLGGQVYATETYTYNHTNRMTTRTDPLGYTYSVEYDSKGRPVAITKPDGTFKTILYNDASATATLSDENLHTKQMKYGWNGGLLFVKEFIDGTTSYFTQYTYDQAGFLLQITDANGNATTYEYDSPFGLTEVIYPDSTTETFTYDKVGNLTSRTDANGSMITYQYDAVYRLTQIQYPDAGTIQYEYDLNGNRTMMADTFCTSTYTYDSRNRLISETRTVDGIAYTVESGYDQASRLISITYPEGTVINFVYDDLNRLISVPGYAEYTYNANSWIKSILYGNGVQTGFSYECLCGRPTQIHVEKNGNDLLNLLYTYDAVGNITQLEEGIFNPKTQVFETSTELYTYDWLDRLVSETNDSESLSYSYDPVGNRIASNGTEYTYNSANELITMNDGTTFAYDQNGNMLSKTNFDTWTYLYDYDNQLTQVQSDGQTIDQYVYDGDGKRIQKTEWLESSQTFQTTSYIYGGFSILYEKNTDTGMDAFYVYGPTGRIAKKAGDAVYYYHTDHLESTRLVTDENGTVVTQVIYQSFGTSESKGESEKYLFTGKEYDASQLYYFGARYYDSELGRFITRDPQSGELNNPQSLNRYVYCLNNPLRHRDAWGLSVSSGDGDCDCIDRYVKDLLYKLRTIERQLKQLQDWVDNEIRILDDPGGSYDDLDDCLDFLNDLGWQIPAMLDENREVNSYEGLREASKGPTLEMYFKIFEVFPIIQKFVQVTGYALFVYDLVRVFGCVNTTWKVGSSQRAIISWGIMKYNKINSREELIGEISTRCPCALESQLPPLGDIEPT